MLSCACSQRQGGVTAERVGQQGARALPCCQAPIRTLPYTGGKQSASASGRAHLALDHLRRQVVKGPAECRAPRMWRVHRPTKVCNLELAPEIEQQVLRLDVAVDHVLRVAVVERAGQRLNVLPQDGQGGVLGGQLWRLWEASGGRGSGWAVAREWTRAAP